jgi:hypothetical protein
MTRFAAGTGIVVAVSAVAMSVVSVFFVTYGYPWPSVAWAFLACAAAVWVVRNSVRPVRSMNDVINDVESESPRAKRAVPSVGTP